MEREPLKPGRDDRRPEAPHHHQGGDRLSQVDVVFEVASQPYPLGERAATLMAETLRVKAAHEPGVWALYDSVKRPHDGPPRQKS
jgi:hypothetical protein